MSSVAFTGDKATTVVLSAITTLSLSLIISIWYGDWSSTVALVGLTSVYIGSSELLVLFFILSPISVVIDIIKLSSTAGLVRYHGFLVFLVVLEMLSKVIGAFMAWTLHVQQSSGEAQYSPVASGQRTNQPAVSQGVSQSNYQPPAAAAGGFAPSADPFASYTPGPNFSNASPPVSTAYQPFPSQPPTSGHHTLEPL
ncbi:hypothetical protein CEUSTIGMA_g4869.t1 [Chlamydomonas eustigma]|uniref:Uncharacterized protein n=1 Tax=Chlamydomonas eustigma TaxID=1157962 RepID=A0A250X2V7_9CHLO|nr:hypothetical protein CEUSTIGMA_g4869.t1 [Chlamydomonas eustigma]|eukprot:GAX77424.1 hypothetical protein CEUSTIGMA_g4869.t1 [Chlamydomonas eustigma]